MLSTCSTLTIMGVMHVLLWGLHLIITSKFFYSKPKYSIFQNALQFISFMLLFWSPDRLNVLIVSVFAVKLDTNLLR